MKNYIVLFREPDGRTIQHSNEELHQHQTSWKNWLEIWGKEGKLNGGSSLTLTGRIIRGKDRKTTNDIYKVGTEIVGGYLLIKACDLDEATEIIRSCPVFDFDGYAEIRELQN